VDDLGAVAGLDGEVVEAGVVADFDGGDGTGWSVPVFVLLAIRRTARFPFSGVAQTNSLRQRIGQCSPGDSQLIGPVATYTDLVVGS
jgi:hypothetical protein